MTPTDARYEAGLNSLAGPLHGLANQEVLGWIQELQASENLIYATRSFLCLCACFFATPAHWFGATSSANSLW